MPMTMKSSESKPKVEFQYGGRLFSKSGSIACGAKLKTANINVKTAVVRPIVERHIIKQQKLISSPHGSWI